MAAFHPTHNGDIVHLNVGGTRYGRFKVITFCVFWQCCV